MKHQNKQETKQHGINKTPKKKNHIPCTAVISTSYATLVPQHVLQPTSFGYRKRIIIIWNMRTLRDNDIEGFQNARFLQLQ